MFVLLRSLLMLYRNRSAEANFLIENLDGPPVEVDTDGQWFCDLVAVLIILPFFLALAVTAEHVWRPHYLNWRECCAMHPGFPP